jgi:adenylyltransferase/sulfurtransferase
MTDAVKAKVLIVGVGGLGCPASLALAKGGVRRLTLMDPDKVDVSNLHRQPWHRGSDVGRLKVESAADGLREAFPGIQVETRAERLTAQNAEALFRAHDLVVDATDTPADKFLLSDAAVLTGTALVHGGALRLAGQAMLVRKGGPCLRCLFETPPLAEACAQVGVLGSVTGVVGAYQALLGLQALGLISAQPQDEEGVEPLWTFDGATLSQRKVPVRRAKDCKACAQGAQVVLKDAGAEA